MRASRGVEGAEADPWAPVDPDPPRGGRRRSVVVALAIAAVVFGAAAWLTNSISLRGIAADGSIGAQANSARAAAIDARSRVAEAVAVTRAVDMAPDDLEAAITAARVSLDSFDGAMLVLVDTLEEGAALHAARADELRRSLDDVLAALTEPDRMDAELGGLMLRADRSFDVLTAGLAFLGDEALEDVASAADAAGQAEVAGRVIVIVVIPLALAGIYRLVAARATRRHHLALALEHERNMVKAKDELIANISHELRTPLTGIVGFAQMAALDTELSAGELRTMAGMIATESEELARMVDDLITTARDKEDALALAIEDVDPNQELAVVGVPVVIAGRDMAVDLHPGPLRADRLRLRQILRNLISNALKYGGPSVRLHGEATDGRYELSVIDDGPGIPPELEDRLFTRFVHQGETPLMTGSVGLGLSIAHRLAEIMGGSLIHRRIGRETYFTLSLPLSERAQEPSAAEVA